MQYIFCVVRCCLWCLETCVRWLTKKCYIMTVITGGGFCTSICSVAAALFSMFSYIVITEFASTIMLFFGKLSIALGTGAIGAVSLNALTGDLKVTSVVGPTIVITMMGFVVAQMFMMVYDMTIDSMLMCFCEV